MDFLRRRVAAVALVVSAATISGALGSAFGHNGSKDKSTETPVEVTTAVSVLPDDNATSEMATIEVEQVSRVSDFPTLSPVLTYAMANHNIVSVQRQYHHRSNKLNVFFEMPWTREDFIVYKNQQHCSTVYS